MSSNVKNLDFSLGPGICLQPGGQQIAEAMGNALAGNAFSVASDAFVSSSAVGLGVSGRFQVPGALASPPACAAEAA